MRNHLRVFQISLLEYDGANASNFTLLAVATMRLLRCCDSEVDFKRCSVAAMANTTAGGLK